MIEIANNRSIQFRNNYTPMLYLEAQLCSTWEYIALALSCETHMCSTWNHIEINKPAKHGKN